MWRVSEREWQVGPMVTIDWNRGTKWCDKCWFLLYFYFGYIDLLSGRIGANKIKHIWYLTFKKWSITLLPPQRLVEFFGNASLISILMLSTTKLITTNHDSLSDETEYATEHESRLKSRDTRVLTSSRLEWAIFNSV